MIPFEHLAFTPAAQRRFEKQRALFARDGRIVVAGRVTSLDRGYPLVCTNEGEFRAELAAAIKKSADSSVAVGDWVALEQPEGHEKAVIACVLERDSELVRVKRVGREGQLRRQVLAANVDTAFICQSLTGAGPDYHLLMRQMAAVAGCGIRPVFVFTKGDLVDAQSVAAARQEARELAADIELVVLSVMDASSVESVRKLCVPQTTSLLLGESGVGKSSLVNALIGAEAASVGAVRESDDKGRHTTVARRMLEIPGAGLLIDAPGLRTLQILDMQTSLEAAFPDVMDAACSCKFRDCTHTGEPGCAVVGKTPAKRLEAFIALRSSDWRA